MKTMFRKILITLAALCGLATSAYATSFGYTWEQPVGFIQTSAYTSAPDAFMAFCKKHPQDCKGTETVRYVVLDATRMRDLNTVNMDVNDTYFFNTDLQGRDSWDYASAGDGYADCEDYALEKRKRLMELGWPSSALLLTMAERRNETLAAWRYHVVLTVRTAQGDYVLDNDIRPAVSWDKAARLYRFMTMQSPSDPKLWVAVDSQHNASIDSPVIVR